jgi:hypothetical protein
MAEYVWEEADKSNPWGRKRAKGSHCSRGHEFTEENTFIRPYDKTRVCRECRRQYARKKYQENKKSGKSKTKAIPIQTFELPDTLALDNKQDKLYRILQKGLETADVPCRYSQDVFDNPENVDDNWAEELCHGCPLLKQCYEFAVASNQEYGIWGGINFTHRRYKSGAEWFASEDLDSFFITE